MDDLVCISTIHEKPVPAAISGTFDGSHINGGQPSRANYCEYCANALEVFGVFTPDTN